MQIDIPRYFGLADDPFRPRGGDDAMAPTSLNQDQARGFVRDRLASAGARTGLFSRAALDAVVTAAGGVRHRLRWLAGLAMLEAALEGSRRVEAGHVKAAIAQAYFVAAPVLPDNLDTPARAGRRSWWPADVVSGLTGATVLVLALLIGALLIGPVTVQTSAPRHTIGHPSPERRERVRPEPVSAVAADGPIRASAVLGSSLRPSSSVLSRVRLPLVASVPLAHALLPSFASVSHPADGGLTAASHARVFIHYRPQDRLAAQDLARRLYGRGWTVTALRAVDAVVRQPNTRFFYAADAIVAADLRDDLADTIGEPVSARDMRAYPRLPRPGTLEVWLPPQG